MSPVNAPHATKPGNGTTEWRTPPELFYALDRRYDFDYDPCASHGSALCAAYSTPGGTYVRSAGRPQPLLLSSDDGLHNRRWDDARVFMNPPYARGEIERWVEKAYRERNAAQIIVALLPAATDTRWFQTYILPHCHIDWLPQRVRFVHPDEPCGDDCSHKLGAPGPSPTAGHVVAVFHSDLTRGVRT